LARVGYNGAIALRDFIDGGGGENQGR